MLDTLIKFSFFIGIGVAWRFAKPTYISSGELRKALLAALYFVFLPALVLSILWLAKFTPNSWRILVVMLSTTGVGLAAAWLVYQKVNVSPNIKGAFILAAAFGSVMVIGAPISQAWVAGWTLKTAVYFESLVMFPVLLTAGALLAKKFGGSANNVALDLIKEPVIIAVALGLALNFGEVKMPGFVANWLNLTKLGILPLGLIVVGLSLNWNKQCNSLIPFMLPAAAIQLIILPLAVWGFIHVFGITGTQTLRSTVIHAAMPSMVFGFIICDRYRLDSNAYAAIFSFTTAVSLITVPIWWTILKKGIIS